MADALNQNLKPPMASPTRFLGSVFVALLITSGLGIAIAGAQQPTTVVLTKFANGLLKLNLPGATLLYESSISWQSMILAGVLGFAILAAAFLIGNWLYAPRPEPPRTAS